MARLYQTTVEAARLAMRHERDVIVYEWQGAVCARRKPMQVHNPRTTAQQRQRSAFRTGVRLAADLREALMPGLRQAARHEGLTPYNLFMRMNSEEIARIASADSRGWATLRLSAGPLQGVSVTGTAVASDEKGTATCLTVRFASPDGGAASDTVRLYAYSPSLARGVMAEPTRRDSGQATLTLPEAMVGHAVLIYAFACNAQGQCSPTAFGGELDVERRRSSSTARTMRRRGTSPTAPCQALGTQCGAMDGCNIDSATG